MNKKLTAVILLGWAFSIFACGLSSRDETARQIMDALPVYEGAKFIGESRTSYPDSEPSLIREYQSGDTREKVMKYYQSELEKQGWTLEISNISDPYAPAGILAKKDGWRLSVLFYSTGKFSIRLYLN